MGKKHTAEKVARVLTAPYLRRIRQFEGFKLLADRTSPRKCPIEHGHLLLGAGQFIAFVGGKAVGKSELCSTLVDKHPRKVMVLPVATTRPLRPEDTKAGAACTVKYLPDDAFNEALARKEFLFAYRLGSAKKARQGNGSAQQLKRSGLLIKDVEAAVEEGKKILVVIPAPVHCLLNDVFPGTRPVLVRASSANRELYCGRRGVDAKLAMEVSEFGFATNYTFYLPGLITVEPKRYRLTDLVTQAQEGHALRSAITTRPFVNLAGWKLVGELLEDMDHSQSRR